MNLYPLKFEPTFRQYIWGGRRLGTKLNKPIGDARCYAESWEIVDHGDDQSVIANGSLAGATLGAIARDHANELFGKSVEDRRAFTRFPLLFKFLDANRTLSVQVHPNDQQAALLDPPDLGKSEAWYVIDAEPGSRIYAGLKAGVDRDQLAAACETGTVDDVLHSFVPEAGDCVNIPAGTVHAIGEGLLVAEIQQSSDTTYRLFDWNRVDADGNPRQLHVQEALEVVDFDAGPVLPVDPVCKPASSRWRLVTCDKFVLDRIEAESAVSVGGDDQFHIVSAVRGDAAVSCGRESPLSLPFGSTILIPACAGKVSVQPSGELAFLDAYLSDL